MWNCPVTVFKVSSIKVHWPTTLKKLYAGSKPACTPHPPPSGSPALVTAFFPIFVHLPAILWFYLSAGPVCILVANFSCIPSLCWVTHFLSYYRFCWAHLIFSCCLLRVFAVFILILLYKLWWFPNVLVIIFEVFFFLYSYLKHFCYQICDIFGFKFLLQKTSPTPSSIRMQLLCLLVKTYIQMLFVLVLWKIPLVAW